MMSRILMNTASILLNMGVLGLISQFIWPLTEVSSTFASAKGQRSFTAIKQKVHKLTIIHLPGLPTWQHTWGVFSFKGGAYAV